MGCVFWGKMKPFMANAEIGKIVAEQGERPMDNDRKNPL
jgi:hypothetical protein